MQTAPQMASTLTASNQPTTSSNVQTANVLSSIEFNHQTFQAWIDLLVDANTTEDIKLKTVQDLSLNLEVFIKSN